MFFNIYSAILLTLMFIMNLTSFSIMICSIKNYLKNKTKTEIKNKISNIKQNIIYNNELLARTNNQDEIAKITDVIADLKNQLKELEK